MGVIGNERHLHRSPVLESHGGASECNEVDRYGKKEAGTGEHLTHLNQITNTNETRQPLTDDCHTQNTN